MRRDKEVFTWRLEERRQQGFTCFEAHIGAPIIASIPGTTSQSADKDIGVFARPRGNAGGRPAGGFSRGGLRPPPG